MISLTSLLTGLGCLLILIFGVTETGVLKTIGFAGAWSIIGIGEILLFPILPAMVNDLAPDALRMHYNSFFNLSWQAGSIAGPLFAGWGYAYRGSDVLIGMTLFALLLSFAAILLERVVPGRINQG